MPPRLGYASGRRLRSPHPLNRRKTLQPKSVRLAVTGALSNFKIGALLVAIVSLCGLIGLATTAGASDEPGQTLPPLVNEADADRFEPTTDQAAAEELPLRDLGRTAAEDLLQEVFGAELEVPAEFFNELEVEAFRSDH